MNTTEVEGVSVLQVSAFFPAHGGGIEVVAGEVAKRCCTNVREFTWIAGDEREIPNSNSFPGVRLIAVRSYGMLERLLGLPLPLWGIKGMIALWSEIKRADVVHVHDFLYFSSLVAILFSKFLGKPVLLTQHVGDISYDSRLGRLILFLLNRSLGRFIMSSVNQVSFISEHVRDLFGSFVNFSTPPLLIRNGVDHLVYLPAPKRNLTETYNLLFVGRFVEKKGVSLLRDCTGIPGVQWKFVGDGPLSPALWSKNFAENTQVFSNVRGRDVVRFYQWADLLVLPSTGEGFPLVVQEALACGIPVLVSKEVYDTFPEVDEACVFYVDLEDASKNGALRERLLSLLNSKSLGVAAKERAVALSRCWDWDVAVSAYLECYRGLSAGMKF